MLEKTICAVVFREETERQEHIIAYAASTPQTAIDWLHKEGLDYDNIPYHFSLHQLKVDSENKDILLPGETHFLVSPKAEAVEVQPFETSFEEGFLEEVYFVSVRSHDVLEAAESLKGSLLVSTANKNGYMAKQIIHVASSKELAEKWLLEHANDYKFDNSYFFAITGENVDHEGFYPNIKDSATEYLAFHNKDGSLNLDYHCEEE